ncbi:MAG: PAS domain-containing protein [Acidobacteria bacterium]|nr:PAS domain-containing protein [Acidobacteriota bacterium]MBI3487221.1 PAS domain-containing protein [Acidobacteriota bacterium]
MRPKSISGGKKAQPAKVGKLSPIQKGPAFFPIVGIGASAGGLEALDEFLNHLPGDSPLALVVVQHLAPTQPGMMVELLQRSTPFKVLQAMDGQVVKPGHLYVIPPGLDLSILRGKLFLFPPTEPHGLRLPIDFFFQSLAQDRAASAIGIVFSGMGSDGLRGSKAIKENGGMVLAQDPASARYDGMPGSVVREGLADLMGTPAKLAGDLIRLLAGKLKCPLPEPFMSNQERSSFERICILLRARTGHDFSLYKKSTIYRRIERRMGIHGIASISEYVQFIEGTPPESELLFKELLIGVTSFFRDPESWKQLAEEVIPALIAARPEGGVLRAWVPGCSTGEEACSLAITFMEVLKEQGPRAPVTLQIFATDLDRDAVEKGRQGSYSPAAMSGLSDERRLAWFIPDEHGFKLRKEIREMLVYAIQDVIQDPPFIRLDLLLCRNLLIYFSSDLQKRVLPLFHYSLNPNGCLFLGSAESIGPFTDLFVPHPGKARLFYRKANSQTPGFAPFPITLSLPRESTREATVPKAPINLQALADQVLLHRFAPPAVLSSESGDILYISGKTGNYLEPAMGKANWNLFAMAREGLRTELGVAFRKALGQTDPVIVRGLRVGTNAGTQMVDLTVQALQAPEALKGTVMTVFSNQTDSHPVKFSKAGKGLPPNLVRLSELEAELKSSLEELQSNREEMQTSQEELKATNEELQSTNEELQSTNEELTTSKEELQSLNEELQTVNAEQQSKVEELSATNNDMKNLLDATDIATLFLDEHLHVRRFTKGATRIFKLIQSDVGRPITDIVSNLDYPGLERDATEVLRTLVLSEREVPAQQGEAWFSTRILPYRTIQNAIGGLVVTFTEITRAKALEADLRTEVSGKPKGGSRGQRSK